jgi:hypothetical protein
MVSKISTVTGIAAAYFGAIGDSREINWLFLNLRKHQQIIEILAQG